MLVGGGGIKGQVGHDPEIREEPGVGGRTCGTAISPVNRCVCEAEGSGDQRLEQVRFLGRQMRQQSSGGWMTGSRQADSGRWMTSVGGRQ